MNVFLTGGTGFVGMHLAQALLKRGWQVTALVRRPEGAEAQTLLKWGASLAPGDVTRPESLRTAMQGADLVIHNAAVYEFGLTPEAKRQMREINVQGTENILSLAVELGIPKIIYVSSILAYGTTGPEPVDECFIRQSQPLSQYEATKTEAHEIALRYQRQGAPLVIVCPGGVIGPGDHTTLGYYVRMYVRGRCLPFLATGRRATIYVEDCAEAIALAAEKGRLGETYILTGPALSTKEMFNVWKTAAGGPKFMLYLPRRMGEWSCALAEPFERLLGLPMILSREVFIAGSVNWCYSGAKAERELGAHFRSTPQAWLDALEGERQRANAGRGWRDTAAV